MQNLPNKLYSVDAIVQLEQIAISQFGISAYELMQRAGQSVFDVIQHRYPHCKKILVLCGAGNNAGDGYVVARLARQAGYQVTVISLIDPDHLKEAALQAYKNWLTVGRNANTDFSVISEADVIVDALLGTGLTREVCSQWAECIDAVNQSSKPVVAVDIPSGLLADTGVVSGVAIQAEITVCFIGLKQGMFTAQANDVCGEIVFSDLELPEELYSLVKTDTRLIQKIDYSLLPKRKASSHKGKFGHVLIVGGNVNMPGAIILAAKAALRTGAGLVTIVTVAENLQAISAAVPEAMVKICTINNISDTLTEVFVARITHVAIGMGLGQDEWSLALLRFCVQLDKPMLIDADALSLLATHDIKVTSSLVITPHPGEASRLLSKTKTVSSADIQADRFAAIKAIHSLFEESESCVVVLKGSGSLIFDGRVTKVCSLGSAAMAAPGMGDVLSG
ncbi:MAG: NAD(P)H-hydrate dehydratase, partial [Gammaproteobacteria bacterium]|nr:NAD(P)H-hydrate dehydratase [Gammaproteobacteria bacterium]